MRLIEMTSKLIYRMRWRAFFFLNPSTSERGKDNYGFNSKRTPPLVPDVNEFETKITELIQKVEFKISRPSEFQKKLSAYSETIRNDSSVFVAADKTTNLYRMPANHYEALMKKNIEKEYKKAHATSETNVAKQNLLHKAWKLTTESKH